MPRRRYDVSIYPFSRQLEGRRQQRRADFRETIGVRFESDPASSDLPHIYLPRLHRQKTEKDQNTQLGSALQKMAEENGIDRIAGQQHQLTTVQREVREFTDWITKHLRKNDFDLDFRQPIVVESFPPWRCEDKVIPCLLPFAVRGVRMKPLEPGYLVIQLPRRDSLQADEFAWLRAEDKLHLSPRKTYQVYNKILRKAFNKQTIPFERLKMVIKDDHVCILYDLRNYGWTLEIIPSVHLGKSNTVLVSKPFHTDENAASEMRWRLCLSQKEGEIIRSISCTDKGVRLKALHIVCKLCKRDWRLSSLNPYQIQTVLLFDMDHHIDSSPRWQRCTLEQCVLSLLDRLLFYCKAGYLPHFIVEGMDLFGLLPRKTIILYRSALERLTNNEKALISLVERTRPEQEEEEPQWLETQPSGNQASRPYQQIPTIIGIV